MTANDNTTLTGKVAIVTGAAGGIGEAVARGLARGGAHVLINDISADRANILAKQLDSEGLSAHPAPGNVTVESDVDAVIDDALTRFGRLDIMVNNAGIENAAALRKVELHEWNRVLDVNLTGVLLGCRAAARAMTGNEHGRIVNISSRAWLGWWGQASYAASKGGVVSLTRALSLELARHHITVNCIAPGLIETPMYNSLPEATRHSLQAAQPTGTVGDPSDVANLVRFLSDDRARSITGQVLYACGGKSLFAMPARR